MKKIIIILLLVSNSLYAKSQEIKITVVDSISNLPVSYANIIIDSDKGIYTNENGNFYIDKSNCSIQISHIGYKSKIIKPHIKCDTVKLQSKTYNINEVMIMPKEISIDVIGYYKYKSNFTIPGFSGDELAVYFPNIFNCEKYIKKVIIGFETKKIIKKYIGINFVSVFRINFYLKNKNSTEPDRQILIKDMAFTSKILKNKTEIDISKYGLKMPPNGVFISIEWIGIQSNDTKELITNYKKRTEPFISTTFKKTNTVVYERNLLKNNKWKLVGKNNKYSIALKKDNFYTPRISLSLY